MPVNVRVKGKKWERAVATKLRPLFGARVKRGYQTRSGREAPDVDGTPFWIECKHGKAVNVRAALAQAIAASDGRPPVVVAKDHGRGEAMVIMRLSDWLPLTESGLQRIVVDGLKGAGDDEISDEAHGDGGGGDV